MYFFLRERVFMMTTSTYIVGNLILVLFGRSKRTAYNSPQNTHISVNFY